MNNQNNNPMNNNKNDRTMKANKGMKKVYDPRNVADKTAMDIDQISQGQEDSRKVSAIYSDELNKDWGLVQRFAQKDMYKAVVANRKALFNATAEHRLEFYSEVLDARLGALREQTQAGLMMIRGHYRRQVAAYMTSEMELLVVELGEKRESLFLKMAKNYDFIEKLNGNEFLINRYLEDIQNETERVSSTMEKLAQNFEQSIMEQVSKYRSGD
jgi:hypothetical protein